VLTTETRFRPVQQAAEEAGENPALARNSNFVPYLAWQKLCTKSVSGH
jgi:hypothetical protein